MATKTRTLKAVCRLGFLLLSLAAVLLTSGCFTRTVYVPAGSPVRLRQQVKVKCWAYDKDGKPVAGTMTVPEGWWFVEDAEQEKPEAVRQLDFEKEDEAVKATSFLDSLKDILK